MKIRVGFTFIFTFLIVTGFCQTKYLTEHPVYLDLTEQYIYISSGKDSSIITDYGDQDKTIIKVFDLTPKGAMKFIFMDTFTKMIVKGQYKAAIRLSPPRGYSKHGSFARVKKGGTTQSHYRPSRDGVWYYRDYRGNLVRTETYKQASW